MVGSAVLDSGGARRGDSRTGPRSAGSCVVAVGLIVAALAVAAGVSAIPVIRERPAAVPGADPPRESSGAPFATSSPGAPEAPPAAQCAETLRLLTQMSTLLPDDSVRERLRETVILDHMRYAWHIAALYSSHDEPARVTRAMARAGLARAADEYDPGSGIDFLTYATPVIVREVRALRALTGTAKSPARYSRRIADALPGCADRLTAQLGRSPTIAEIASALSVGSEAIVESLDAALGTFAVQADLTRQAAGAERECAGNVLDFRAGMSREQIRILLAPLSERNKRIVVMRYVRGMTDAQIGAKLNISPVHVHRLLKQAMSALRAAESDSKEVKQPRRPSDGSSSVAA